MTTLRFQKWPSLLAFLVVSLKNHKSYFTPVYPLSTPSFTPSCGTPRHDGVACLNIGFNTRFLPPPRLKPQTLLHSAPPCWSSLRERPRSTASALGLLLPSRSFFLLVGGGNTREKRMGREEGRPRYLRKVCFFLLTTKSAKIKTNSQVLNLYENRLFTNLRFRAREKV